MKKQAINEVKQFQKIAGLLNENWHPDDPASVDVDDIEDEDPDDYDDISEERGYRADKDPEVLYKVKDLVKSMVNRFGKSSITIGSPEWNKLVSSLEALFERLRVNIDSSEFFGDTLLDILQDLQVDINHGDNISEDTDTRGRTSYDLVKGPNEDPLVKRILVNLHNKYGKEGYHYDPYMKRLTVYGEASEDEAIVDMLSALFDQPEYQDLSEDENESDSESGNTDAMGGINEKSSKVDHFYSKIIGAIEKVSKRLDDDSVHELHEKLKAFFNKTI